MFGDPLRMSLKKVSSLFLHYFITLVVANGFNNDTPYVRGVKAIKAKKNGKNL